MEDETRSRQCHAVHYQRHSLQRWGERVEADSKRRGFVPAAGKPHLIPMLHRFGKWSFVTKDSLQAVRLPYGRGEFAMCVKLPATGTLDDWFSQRDADS